MTKTIIITGASSGIGSVLTQLLAKAGNQVIAIGRNEQALQELYKSYPQHVKVVAADITNEEDRTKIKDALPSDEDGVYLVHNAGIAIPGLLTDLTEEKWDQHYLVNTKAPVFLTKCVLPHLKNGGRILNVSTGLAHNALAGFSAYGTSKAALYLLKEYFNAEFKAQDILCGSAMPGVVDTPIQAHIRATSSTEFPAVNIFQGFQERGELLTPQTAARFLAWLLLDTDKDQFTTNDWNIYDVSHHHFWAQAGEVKQRQ